jgi:hypothetical protein
MENAQQLFFSILVYRHVFAILIFTIMIAILMYFNFLEYKAAKKKKERKQ